MRIGVGDPRAEPDVGGDHRGAMARRGRDVSVVGEAADVVADDRAGGAARVEHRRAPGVDRDRRVEAGGERFDRGHDPVELLGLADLRARARLDPADVEEIRARGHELLGAREEGVEGPGRAAVVEGVGGAIEDAHDERAGRDLVANVTEADRRVRHHGPEEHRRAGYRRGSGEPP